MDDIEEFLVGAAELLLIDFEETEYLIRPPKIIRQQIELPVADMRDSLGLG